MVAESNSKHIFDFMQNKEFKYL